MRDNYLDTIRHSIKIKAYGREKWREIARTMAIDLVSNVADGTLELAH